MWCLCPGQSHQPWVHDTATTLKFAFREILQHLLFPQTFLPGTLFAPIFEESKQRGSLNTNIMDVFSQSLPCSNPKPTTETLVGDPSAPGTPWLCPVRCLCPLLAMIPLQILLYFKEDHPDLAACRTTVAHHPFALTLDKHHFNAV